MNAFTVVVLYTVSLLLAVLVSVRAWSAYIRVRRNGPAHLIAEKFEDLRFGLAVIAWLTATAAFAIFVNLLL